MAGCAERENITKTNKDLLNKNTSVWVNGKNLSVLSPKYKEPIYALTLGFQRSYRLRYNITPKSVGKTITKVNKRAAEHTI